MSIHSSGRSADHQPDSTGGNNAKSQLTEKMDGHEVRDAPSPSANRRLASDSDQHETQGHGMQPPPLPSVRTAQVSIGATFRPRSPFNASPQLPTLRQLAREAPESERFEGDNRGNPSSDRSSDTSYTAYAQQGHQQYRSPLPPHHDSSASASASPRPPVGRSNPATSTSSSEGVPLHEVRTSISAPPPAFPGLPHHSPEDRTYQLVIRQQPHQGRLCGLGSKDKRPLDPLPILQLRILKPDGTEDEDAENSPNLILHVTLRKHDPATGTHTEAMLVDTNDPAFRLTRMLEGRTVASANVARDLDGSRACFFVFTDLSIRQEGQFRLAFKLLALGPPSGATAPGGQVLADVLTEPFTIYSPRRFPGMTESTDLAKLLAKQGIQVPLRNDVRRRQDQPNSSTASTNDVVAD